MIYDEQCFNCLIAVLRQATMREGIPPKGLYGMRAALRFSGVGATFLARILVWSDVCYVLGTRGERYIAQLNNFAQSDEIIIFKRS